MPSANLNRRALLAGTASAASLSVIAPSIAAGCVTEPAAAAEPDPIFAAIERHRRAERATEAAELGPEDAAGDAKMAAADDDVVSARWNMAETVPTTPDGLLAYLRFLDEESCRHRVAFFDGDDENIVFYHSLHCTIAAILGRPLTEDKNADAAVLALCKEADLQSVAVEEVHSRWRDAQEALDALAAKKPKTLRYSWRDEEMFRMEFGPLAHNAPELDYFTDEDVTTLRSHQQKNSWAEWLRDSYRVAPSERIIAPRAARCAARAERILAAWDRWQATLQRARDEVARRWAAYRDAQIELRNRKNLALDAPATTIAGLFEKREIDRLPLDWDVLDESAEDTALAPAAA